MAITINTNVSSLNAQRNLGKSQNALSNAMQRLSSGLRINSAKDDAAGLAISDRMTSQIRGLNQASRNANDGISLSQTAEGALQESTNILQRMRELAVQSANDTNTSSDRASLQAEVSQLKAEMDRIAQTTQFNGKNLLDGTMENATFQVGANAGIEQTISFSIAGAKTADLSSVGTTISAPVGDPVTATSVTGALTLGQLSVNGNVVGATTDDAVSLASAINNADSSVTATAQNVQTINFSDISLSRSPASLVGTGPVTGAALIAGDMLVNGYAVAPTSGDAAAIAAAIHTADTTVTATATNAQTIAFSNVTLGQASIAGGTVLGALSAGQLLINNVDVGAVANPGAAGSLAGDIASAIQTASQNPARTAGSQNVTAVAANSTSGAMGAFTTTAGGTYSLTIEGVNVYTNEAAGLTAATLFTAVTTGGAGFNDELTAAGVTVTGVDGNNLVFTKANGSNLNIVETLGAGGSAGGFASGVNGAVITSTREFYGSVTLTSNGDISLTGTAETQAGFTNNDTDTSGKYAISLGSVALDTSGANFTDGSVTVGDVAALINAVDGYTAAVNGAAINIARTDGGNIVLAETITAPGTTANAGTGIVDGTSYGTITLTSASDITLTGNAPAKGGFGTLTADAAATGTYALAFDGVAIGLAGALADDQINQAEMIAAIDGLANFSAVAGEEDGDIVITKTNNAANFTIAEVSDVDNNGADAASVGLAGVAAAATTYRGQVILESAAPIVFEGDTAALTAAGLNTTGNNTTSIDLVDISTREGAITAISSVDAALSQIDVMRGDLGAVQNRFESTIANLNNVSENLSAARSRILDADIAMETSAMTKMNILQQAGVSILAQANQAPQLALSLLG